MLLIDNLVALYKAVIPTPADGLIDVDQLIAKRIASIPPYNQPKRLSPSRVLSKYTCERQEALRRLEDRWDNRVLFSVEQKKRVDAGSAIHQLFQDSYFGPSGLLWGNWTCPNCHQTTRFSTIPKGWCQNQVEVSRIVKDDSLATAAKDQAKATIITCAHVQQARHERGNPAWIYDEVWLEDWAFGNEMREKFGLEPVPDTKPGLDKDATKPYPIMGGPSDGVLILEDGWVTLEMKSVEDAAMDGIFYQEITEKNHPGIGDYNPRMLGRQITYPNPRTGLPRGNDAAQAGIYGSMLVQKAREGEIPLDPDRYIGALLLYIARGSMRTRLFLKQPNEAHLTSARGVIEDVFAAAAAGNPDRLPGRCKRRSDYAAKECWWQDRCFPTKAMQKKAAAAAKEKDAQEA